MTMLVGLLIICVIGAIIAVLYHLAETLPTVTDEYRPRHSAPGRASWLAEFRLHAGRLHDHAKRAAYLAMVVVPVEEGPDPADVWLDAIRAARPRLGPGTATGTAAYAQLRTEALESTNEQILDLVRHGIRPPSPWGTPELDDVWESEPALVGAA